MSDDFPRLGGRVPSASMAMRSADRAGRNHPVPHYYGTDGSLMGHGPRQALAAGRL